MEIKWPDIITNILGFLLLFFGLKKFAWGPILGPEKIGRVAAYVISRNHEALGIGDGDHDADGEKGEKQS